VPVDPALRQQVMQQAQGTMSLGLAYIGVTNRLFEVLAADGPCDPDALAARAGVDPGYVRRWADAAAAFGHLGRDGERFTLTDQGRAFLPDTPGTLMPLAVNAVIVAHMAERAAGLMASGERPGEIVLGERSTVLPWFGPMLEATFGPMFADVVLPGLPVLAEIGARGGLAVDLGCGNGWYLRRLAARFPNLRGVGLDMFPENIEGARAEAAREGLADRLDFRLGDLNQFAVDEPADLVAMNRALHHVWADGPERVLGRLRDHLAPGGVVLLWEPRWPDDPSTMAADPRLRAMAFQNLSEHVQGNHFLRPAEVEAALAAVGLQPQTFLFADGAEMVVVGRRAA
jgi:SAM-dependent methyltransferase